MHSLRHANHTLRQTRPHVLAQTFRTAYSTGQDKVQTPLQSQKKDTVAPLHPAESSSSVQTPIQSQDPSAVAAKPAQTIRDPGPLYTLFGGLVVGSVFVYFYYQHRKDHMEKKWAAMLKEAKENREAGS